MSNFITVIPRLVFVYSEHYIPGCGQNTCVLKIYPFSEKDIQNTSNPMYFKDNIVYVLLVNPPVNRTPLRTLIIFKQINLIHFKDIRVFDDIDTYDILINLKWNLKPKSTNC